MDAKTSGRIGARVSWDNTKDRTARTAPARAALEQKFLDQADGDPVRATHLRKAYFQRLALKSAEARRKARGAAPKSQRFIAGEDIQAGAIVIVDPSTGMLVPEK